MKPQKQNVKKVPIKDLPAGKKAKGVRGGTEQVLNIGSQSSGSGAGKVTFNPF